MWSSKARPGGTRVASRVSWEPIGIRRICVSRVGGRSVMAGQTTLDGYLKRYPDRAAMGRLVFSDLDITVLSHESALVFGAWKLEREHDQPHGLFTLLLRRFDEGWRIVADHSSSAELEKN